MRFAIFRFLARLNLSKKSVLPNKTEKESSVISEHSSGTEGISLTVAIPTYNRQEYLAELLPELTAQCAAANVYGQRVEVLVVDNASTDSTSEYVVNNFSDHVRYFRNESNIGGDANFIECVKRSLGHYVWLFGDDEIINPNAISTLLDLISKKPALIIAGSSLGESRYFENYSELLRHTLPIDPIFPVQHTLITANVFPREGFNIDVAVARLPTNYGHMYAISEHLKKGKGIFLLGRKESVFTIRDIRAEFHCTPSNLEDKLINLCFYLGKITNNSKLKINVWLFYRAFRIYKLVHSKTIHRLLSGRL